MIRNVDGHLSSVVLELNKQVGKVGRLVNAYKEVDAGKSTNEKKSTWWYRPLMKFLGSYVGLFIILMIYISGGAYYFNQRLLNWIFF